MAAVEMAPEQREVNRFLINIKGKLKCSLENFLSTLVGLVSSVLDIGLDIYAAASFYKEKTYEYLGILLLILVGSSVLAQIYSWLFYSHDDFERKKRFLSQRQLKVLHVFQLGIFFRYYEFLRVATGLFSFPDQEGIADYLSHDFGFLRLIETFSESAPQLVLMLYITLKQRYLDYITVWKALGSLLAITASLTMHHRSMRLYMRSFQLDKKKLPVSSSVAYFTWNLLLISSRLIALALFASVLPYFIFAHFVGSWLVLFFFAWRSKIYFMDKPCTEWLSGVTMGLIWYVNWLKMIEGNTWYKTLLYHGYILTDNIILCSLWCWHISIEPPYFKTPSLLDIFAAACVVLIYIIGLIIRKVYYKSFHSDLKIYKGSPTEQEPMTELKGGPTEDEVNGNSSPQAITPMVEADQHHNERMRKLAEHFYIS